LAGSWCVADARKGTPGMDRYAVAGNPVSHSLSPTIHAMFARQTGQRMSYDRLFVAEGEFERAATNFFADGGCGLNVTLPYKGTAFAWLGEDRCRGNACVAQTVNTIAREEDRLIGHNTDGIGLIRDLGWHGIRISGARVLVLGAGGAVQGVMPALIEQGPSMVLIANRKPEKAVALAEKHAGNDSNIRGVALSEIDGTFDLVINGTSAGLVDVELPVPESAIRDAWCYDMMYGPKAKFHHWAGSVTSKQSFDGIGMLIEQAAEAFHIWRGVMPQTAPVRSALEEITK
jgi:shikimate dehydrogenase